MVILEQEETPSLIAILYLQKTRCVGIHKNRTAAGKIIKSETSSHWAAEPEKLDVELVEVNWFPRDGHFALTCKQRYRSREILD